MTPEELDGALRALDTQGTPKTQGHPQSVPAMGPRPADFGPLLPPVPLAPLTVNQPTSPPPRQHRCVPRAYAVSPSELRARICPPLWKALEGMPPGERCGAVFLGPSGVGKSSAAAYAVQRWRAKVGPTLALRERVFWLDALEATDAEKRYRLGSGDPEHLSDAYTAEWLVLDDIGTTTSPTLVQLVLARRYQAGLPTIATTGLTRDEFTSHVGAATARRVLEFGGIKGVFVDCHGGNNDPASTRGV